MTVSPFGDTARGFLAIAFNIALCRAIAAFNAAAVASINAATIATMRVNCRQY
jgi:hypothetical protein